MVPGSKSNISGNVVSKTQKRETQISFFDLISSKFSITLHFKLIFDWLLYLTENIPFRFCFTHIIFTNQKKIVKFS